MAPPTDLVILGAGPAGVGAAYRTARAGHRVVVLERAPGPGGAAASFELDGIRVDHGSHRLHPAIEPRILDDLRGLLGDELQRRPRNGRIYLEVDTAISQLPQQHKGRRTASKIGVGIVREVGVVE